MSQIGNIRRLPDVSRRQGRREERGNVCLLSILLLTLLAALATAFSVIVEKNSRQSHYVAEHASLRRYAESGINLALHELNYRVGQGDGNIGTASWTRTNDVGRDGLAGTGDEGEGDGVPTPGEPNLLAATVGPAGLGNGLLTQTQDTRWPDVKRIVSTAFSPFAMATIEVYVQEGAPSGGGVGAAYSIIVPRFEFTGTPVIDGHDWNPDGTPGPKPAVNGVSFPFADPPGSKAEKFVSEIPPGRDSRIIGAGEDPSVGEVPPIDFEGLFSKFKAKATNVIKGGSYSNPVWGDWDKNDIRITYATGNINVSGSGNGAGVLLVDGSIAMSNKSKFVGLVMVRDTVKLTGGGTGLHIYGSLMMGKTSDFLFSFTGNSKIRYSSVALAKAFGLLGQSYLVLYTNDLH